MELKDDGTITFAMPSKNGGGDKKITLRRPRLEELFEMWEYVDKLDANRPAEPTEGEDVPEKSRARQVMETMTQNLQWARKAIATLGDPQVYSGEAGMFALSDETLEEPSWLVNGNLAARWLGHWQQIP